MYLGIRTFLLVAAIGFLAACDSAEERAQKHLESALELIELGDDQRAIIEFRNVFKLDGTHRQARKAYADFRRDRGDYQEALGQYLRLVEQYPDAFEGHIAISEIYAEIGNWPEMERFLVAAKEAAPENPKINALQLVFDYRQAIQAKQYDVATVRAAEADELINELPSYLLLRQVKIDDHIRNEAFDLAILGLDDAIELAPNNRTLYAVRLSVLGALEDSEAIEAQLKFMIEHFPDDPSSRATLVRWYVSQDQLDQAEKYLRDAAQSSDATSDDRLTLIRFLSELRSPEIAQQELENLIAAGDTAPILKSLQAGYRFDSGDAHGAIEQMRGMIGELESGESRQTAMIALARMLVLDGQIQEAKKAVDEVLAENAENIQAIKLHAAWLISDDLVGDAITELRSALEFDPGDVEILELLASAYERDGNESLVGEMLALAMDASNRAPAQTMGYARFLSGRGSFDVAERVLIEALRLAPDQVDLLQELGQVYFLTEDWPRAEQVRSTLERIGTQPALNGANELQARILNGQQKSGEAVAFLKGLVEQGSAGLGAHIAIIESHLLAGEPESAKTYVESLLADDPESQAIRFLSATLEVAVGNNAEGEKKYRELLQSDPTQVPVWVALIRLLSANGNTDQANVEIESALLELPNDPTLKWIKAGLLEESGDVDAAIALYEDMYQTDSSNLVVANNLASLLSTHRKDPASLERAYTIARRLRSAEFAAFQDTYGWIAHLRGETSEAIRALESAASEMTADPQVQFHLASAYLAGERKSDALLYFRKVLELTGGADHRDFVVISRSEANRLSSDLSSEGNN